MSRLLFKWTKDGLISANTGRAFTVGGLEALCASHRSDKEDGKSRPFAAWKEAMDKVTELRNNRLDAYKRCPGDIIEHARAERETGLDYSNRLLLELMQNADDAAAHKAIGYKGLGFKSVLDISENVWIRSGFLRVRFDREESRKALLDAELPQHYEVPVLRLPFLDNEEFTVPEIEGLYDTTILLRWNSASDRKELFAKEWKSVSENPTILLLLHSLEEVIWQPLDGDPTVWQCTRSGNVVELSIQTGDAELERSRWQIFRDPLEKTGSAVAVPLDSSGGPLAYRHDLVRVFFPTEENSPLRLLLHGEFDLEQNRKHVRPGGNRAEVTKSIARCVRSVLSVVQDDGTFLDLLAPRDGVTGLEEEIWDAIKAEVRDLPLPQSCVRVCGLRLCPATSAKDFPWYSNRLFSWQEFKEVLSQHRKGGLAGLELLPPGVDTEEREKVVCAFNLGARFTVEELRKVPLFPIEGVDSPVAASDCHLFFPPVDGQLRSAPEGIKVGFLRQGFAAACVEHSDVERLLSQLGVLEFSPSALARVFVAQQLEAAEPKALWEYLLSAIAPLLKESDAVMDWKSKERESLSERVKVPCRQEQWKPAKEVYAGRDWTDDDFLERAYGTRQDCAFLVATPADEASRKRFELLARWLGVGWSPKVVPLINETNVSGTRKGSQWRGSRFPMANPPTRWKRHCEELDEDNENHRRKARLRQDWTLDGDEQILRENGAYLCVIREWRSYEQYLEAAVYRSSNVNEDRDNDRLRNAPSYLSHLFRHVEWIPVEGTEKMLAPQDIFIKDSEVHQTLAGWIFQPIHEVPEGVQVGIGIRSSWNTVTNNDWNRWLSAAAEVDVTKSENSRASVKRLYLESLSRSSGAYYGKIWCVQKRPDNTEEWYLGANRSNVFFIDRPDLARLRLQGIRAFPVELGRNKQKAFDRFGLSPLSGRLSGRAEFLDGQAQAHLTDTIRNRLQDRSDCLRAHLRVRGEDPANAREKWEELEFGVGASLRVTFLLDDRELETQSCASFFQPKSADEPPALWLDAAENFTDRGQPRDILWEEVASALCYSAGLALEDGAVFAALLSCGEDSLKRKLLNLGITEGEIRTVLSRAPLPLTNVNPGPDQSPKQPDVSSPAPATEVQPRNVEEIQPTEIPEKTLDEIVPGGDPLDKIRQASKKLAAETPQRVEMIVLRTVRNDTELVQALKELCAFRCRFPGCGTRIPKKEGGYYIEVAHVRPIAEGGTSVLGNLVVLCPNHHKEFDYGDLQIIAQTEDFLHGRLNGGEF